MEKDDVGTSKFIKQSGPSDHLANERTFLAWIRTSIALMGFGFVVVKFAFFIPEGAIGAISTELLVTTIQGKGPSALVGVIMVALGAMMAILSFIRYSNIEKQLNNNTYFPSRWLSAIITLCIVVGSVLLLVYLFPNVKIN
jgi:putative membrane protein